VSLLLHAITRRTEPGAAAAHPRGLRGGPLVQLDANGLVAWATELDIEATVAFTRTDLFSHHAVVTQLFALVDGCLPARFPTLLDSANALRDQLEAKQGGLMAQLEHIRDCCELALSALWTTADELPPQIDASTPGRNYLLQRRAALAASDRRKTQALELADAIERELGHNLVDVRRRACPSPALALSSALLIKRSSAEEVQTRLCGRTDRDVRILVNGPWPPYTFADARSDQADQWRTNSRSSAASSSF
jgi:hypothetical protein